MQGLAFILFAVFALVLVGLYLAIRREWLRPGIAAGGGVALSIVLMALISLAQNNPPIQAVIVGIVLGTIFSGATLAVAWYFHSQERHSYAAQEESYDRG
jgi:ABC-type Fe3+-siderophore transport system permease subunit